MPRLGRELIIARETATPGTFAAVAITEARSLAIANEEVDITKPDYAAPGGKLKLQVMHGVQSFRVSGAGAFVDNATMKSVVADAVAQQMRNYQVTVPGVGTFEGQGLLSALEFSGDKTNELQQSISLTLSGDIDFEAAA